MEIEMKKGAWSVLVVALASTTGVAAEPAAIARATQPWRAPVAPLADSGYKRFLSKQASAAKSAARKRQWAEAEAAWVAVLELDPSAQQALEGLVDVGRQAGDVDAEAVARRELGVLYDRLIAEGNTRLAKSAAKSAERLAEIDPQAGKPQELLAAYSEAMASLGEAYLADGLYGCALLCWRERLQLTEPGSDAHLAAKEAMQRCLASGEDFVGKLGVVPDMTPEGKDATWIEEHDKKTAKWNRAAHWETPHYRIKTNAGWRLGQASAAVMEQVHAFYREIWGIVPDPKPDDVDPELRDIQIPIIDVNIFSTHEEYVKRAGATEWSGGHFTGSEVETYDHGAGGGGASWRDTLGTLFHEASHQFMHVAVGPSVPSFINEGVASYFEGIEILPNGSIRRDLPVISRLSPLANNLRGPEPTTLFDVMGGPNADENEPAFYNPRWGLVYFLRMYVDDQGHYPFRDRLSEYIYEFKRGTPGDTVEHFTEFFLEHESNTSDLATFEDFETVWRQWILDLDEEMRSRSQRLESYRVAAASASSPADALRFHERALDLDPDDLDSVFGAAVASASLEQADRAITMARRFLQIAPADDPRRADAAARTEELDPHAGDWRDARTALLDGLMELAGAYEEAGMPRLAMRTGHDLLAYAPQHLAARELVARLEESSGASVIRWQRLFNGFDLTGWFGDGLAAFDAGDDEIVCDMSKVIASQDSEGLDADVFLYRNLFLDRDVQGDWTLEARIRTDEDWGIVGLCFGAKTTNRFEAIVLRNKPDDPSAHRVDFGSFEDGWSFRGDGAMRATYDPTGPDGVLLRIDVRSRQVSVTIDGEPLEIMDGGQAVPSIQYPMAALRGDVGLLTSQGITRFRDLRLAPGGRR